MDPEPASEVAKWVSTIVASGLLGAFVGGVVTSFTEGAFWKFLEERRRMQHADRMRIIEQRERLMGLTETRRA